MSGYRYTDVPTISGAIGPAASDLGIYVTESKLGEVSEEAAASSLTHGLVPSKGQQRKLFLTVVLPPTAWFMIGLLIALGHHSFNTWANGRAIATFTLSQDWVTRAGTAFAFGFRSVLAFPMGFVLLQLLWRDVQRSPMSFKDVDTLYLVERRQYLATVHPRTIRRSPSMVIASILGFCLPIAAVFPPGSLGVATNRRENVHGSCTLPSGNLSSSAAAFSDLLYTTIGWGWWEGVTPTATQLATQLLVDQRIPPLPQSCGPDCTYLRTVESFAYKCQEKQTVTPGLANNTFWNATIDNPDADDGSFTLSWRSGNFSDHSPPVTLAAQCRPVLAQYDIEVRRYGGNQSLMINVTETDPVTDIDWKGNLTETNSMYHVWRETSNPSVGHLYRQIFSLSFAARALLLGNITVIEGADSSPTSVMDSGVLSAAFLNYTMDQEYHPVYMWGDVIGGIEGFSHNISASLLNMNLGFDNSECKIVQSEVVYKYEFRSLFLPYGITLGVAGVCLILGFYLFSGFNREGLTTSFSDTLRLTRDITHNELPQNAPPELDINEVLGSTKLRLHQLPDGKMEYKIEKDFLSQD